jgi:hypothetical protein
MADIYIKQGDRLPKLKFTLTAPAGSDLTGATVAIYFRPQDGGTVRTGACTNLQINQNVITGEYAWAAGDTATAGDYFVEFVATLGGLQMTFPNDGFLTMTIQQDLDTGD